jgi:urea transport system substrate-binding protein
MLGKKYRIIISVFAGLMFAALFIWWLWPKGQHEDFIKVGVLHSLSGPLGQNESFTVLATLFAIEEINKQGGVLGKKIVPIIADAKSEWLTFAKEAERLIKEEGVVAIFGCTTSASRKLVKEVVEKYNNLLFYPVPYEGLETSPNIIYLGSTANQQAIPAVNWGLENLGSRLFLVGSDYVFQRLVNGIIKDLVSSRGGSVVGEAYIDIENYKVDSIIKKIIESKPQVIINTIVGPGLAAFYNGLRKAGISSEQVPSISLSVMETDLKIYKLESLVGSYCVQSYFESLEGPANKVFVERFKEKFGEDIVISVMMENAFNSVYLWRDAVRIAKNTKTNNVRLALGGLAMSTPEGIVSVDKENLHLWKPFLIGKIMPNYQIGIVWNSVSTVKPVPFPSFRTKKQWIELVENLYRKWNDKWWNSAE